MSTFWLFFGAKKNSVLDTKKKPSKFKNNKQKKKDYSREKRFRSNLVALESSINRRPDEMTLINNNFCSCFLHFTHTHSRIMLALATL